MPPQMNMQMNMMQYQNSHTTINHNVYNIIIPMYRYRMHDNNLNKNESAMQEGAIKLQEKHVR